MSVGVSQQGTALTGEVAGDRVNRYPLTRGTAWIGEVSGFGDSLYLLLTSVLIQVKLPGYIITGL